MAAEKYDPETDDDDEGATQVNRLKRCPGLFCHFIRIYAQLSRATRNNAPGSCHAHLKILLMTLMTMLLKLQNSRSDIGDEGGVI